MSGMQFPETPATRAALDVATRFHSERMLNHGIRSYLWGADWARRHELPFDDELLFVSALLHDLGLVDEFDNHTLPFEDAGAHVAWVFAAAAGWPVERRARPGEVIVRHMWDEVDPAFDAEGYLLNIATSLDISGRQADDWPGEFRAAVVERYPRLELAEEFVACFRSQAARKPSSSAAAAVGAGIEARMAVNPLDA